MLCAALAVAAAFLLRYPALGAIAIAFIAVVAIAVVLRRQHLLRSLGYVASRAGRDQIRYEEWVGAEVRALTIDGDLGSPHLVYVPTRETWDKDMPAWAHSRRDEIVGRIKQQLGVTKYEFQELKVKDA